MTDAPQSPHEPWTYTRKTPAELEQLAWDVVGGRVFGTWSAPEAAQLSFLVLHMLDKQQLEDMERSEIIHVYEYLDKAGPLSCNGLPSFMSCCYLDKHDAAELALRTDELQALRKARLESASS